MTGPACGNNPNHKLTDGDRRVVESFRTYLAARGALLEAADWYAQQGKTALAAAQVATDLRRRAGAEARHVDASPAATETDEERADREETERDHDRGDHTHCGITCEVELPTEHLRNFVTAKGYPGTKGALAELERRAAANVDLPARLLACGFCYEEQGEEVHPHPECPVGGVAPADQVGLRDRIADVIREFPFDDFGLDDLAFLLDSTPDTQEWVPKLADAVLAVLPATTRHDTDTSAGPVCKDAEGCHRVVPCEPGCGTRNLLAEATRPLPAPADRAAAGARQDGADHVCNSVMARGHMDEPLGYFICGICGTPKNGAQPS
ncbi:hypothetical protein GCM10010330_56790 [Streptomyces tendae]|uniref:hypothetical protein n=1 Tax=Streptomyces tendae TaxID=1932 RepID=UPI0016747E45|nr:hypothetical protein [Streptomyces tendae]GHA95281.1 hypothetical protein GCM10010330_56790 [Streptomyces tendae]